MTAGSTQDHYQAKPVETKWYPRWQQAGLFQPSMAQGAPSFCIVIPPPNVTGALHLGHAWDCALQDILIRWRRMHGDNTLWVPGTDHAGIATQWMVEKQLETEGTSRQELGRERFTERLWAFKHESHQNITHQLQTMGVSCDWQRERFTLDEGLSEAVRKVFVTLYEQGLVYRASRLVNWSPGLRSVISDLEVVHREMDGTLWVIRYPLSEGKGAIDVATTRPETMLGDTAVAVHPADERYRALIGQHVTLPLTGREIPIVADESIDPQFGTGAVKITPGHDANDFALGKRHNLVRIDLLDADGLLGAAVPERFRGTPQQARQAVLSALREQGLLRAERAHRQQVGMCSRSGTVVQPIASLQWFVKTTPLAKLVETAVRQGQIKVIPEFQERILFNWLHHMQDWCVSRQLWWGHRIPVWYHKDTGEVVVVSTDAAAVAARPDYAQLVQDEDVLDTWFSSALWPFSTLGWPAETEELARFYPNATLVTGYDILFFWVARMAMLGLHFLEKPPFHQVLLHGLLRDDAGEKMSKTKGNGIDPIDVAARYGADSLRLTMAARTVLGYDLSFGIKMTEGYHHFINKLWNASRFALRHLPQDEQLPPLAPLQQGSRYDRWIRSRLAAVTAEVERYLEERRFNEAVRVLHGFTWHEFCDWYVEQIKPLLHASSTEDDPPARTATLGTLAFVLDGLYRLLHPFIPHVTEELWQRLQVPRGETDVQAGRFLMTQPYVLTTERDETAEAEVRAVFAVVEVVRQIRGEMKVKPGLKVPALLVTDQPALHRLFMEERESIQALGDLASCTVRERVAAETHDTTAARGVGEGFQVLLLLEGLATDQQDQARLAKELRSFAKRIEQLTQKLDNESFLARAPAEVVQRTRTELASLQARRDKLQAALRLNAG